MPRDCLLRLRNLPCFFPFHFFGQKSPHVPVSFVFFPVFWQRFPLYVGLHLLQFLQISFIVMPSHDSSRFVYSYAKKMSSFSLSDSMPSKLQSVLISPDLNWDLFSILLLRANLEIPRVSAINCSLSPLLVMASRSSSVFVMRFTSLSLFSSRFSYLLHHSVVSPCCQLKITKL